MSNKYSDKYLMHWLSMRTACVHQCVASDVIGCHGLLSHQGGNWMPRFPIWSTSKYRWDFCSIKANEPAPGLIHVGKIARRRAPKANKNGTPEKSFHISLKYQIIFSFSIALEDYFFT